MKRVFCTAVALMIATVAFAGTTANLDNMTPQQAMDKMTNCPVCSAFMVDPALGPTIRHSVFATKTGYVETMMTADAGMMPSFKKAEAECERRAGTIPTMTQAEKDKLCPICTGRMAFMGRADAAVENFNTDMGVITVASSNTPEGVKALHDYAATSEHFGGLLAKAGMDMGKEPMKSKM
ncbi:MAG TPA: hypothetical protein VFX92_09540 [Candidatus Krumholzibacteria bacterium]|nr:hypothetical protein [Candidatus Krumholzibacteria bacterium]